jgi:Asp-tRNA(Asn)/Glu-tRNA(Gln) amidotransferase A subunit family amidase
MTIDPGVAAALERLESLDPTIEAFVPEPGRRARLEAETPADGPLRGLAIGVKDLYRIDGLPTHAGSRLPASVFAGEESAVVTALRAAGASVLGVTAMDEFAYCEPPPTKNPRDPRRTPGGSSGGSAAAVAAGICRSAVGSQTLQSVIVPASYCGVVGYKTSFGRPPFDGIALAGSIDSVGFFAPSVAELRSVVSLVLPGWRDVEDGSAPVLGVPEPWGPPDRAAEGWRGHAGHLASVRAGGAEVRPARVPWSTPGDLERWQHRVGDLLHGEMAAAHEPWFDRFADRYRPRTADAVRWGRAVTADRLRECRDARAELTDLLRDAAARDGVDGWTCPSAATVAPIGYQDTGDVSMTGLWSYAGLPAVSLPVFDGPHGMPLGLQLIALPGRDEELLAWAERVESALGHGAPEPA